MTVWDTEKKTTQRKAKGEFDRFATYRWGATAGSAWVRVRRLVGPLTIVLCAVASLLVALDSGVDAGVIHRGVSVGGVDLGGKTPEEAGEILGDPERGVLGEIVLERGPERFPFSGEEMGVDLDVAGTVDRAYAAGREGSVTERFGDRVRAAFGAASVAPKVDYRPKVAKAKVEGLAARLNEEPREASVSIEGAEVGVVGAREGYEVDVPATMANLATALEAATGEVEVAGRKLEPSVLTPEAEESAEKARAAMSGTVVFMAAAGQWDLAPAQIGRSLDVTAREGEILVEVDRDRLRESLPEMYAALAVQPVESGYEMNGGEVTVTPGQSGKAIDEEALFADLEQGLFEGQREYEVPVVTDEPELTTARAEELKPTELLGRYRTDYTLTSDKSAERVENLRMSSNAIDGMVLAPGETFSMIENVAGLDYNASKVIVDGKETLADGGGLCQVTSTLYMAANYAGLDVTERSPHYAQLPYIRPGLDATVWFGDENGAGALDMKFRNTSDGYVLIREYVSDDGYIYAEVWGRPTGREVEMGSRRVALTPYSATWVTRQRVTEDGEVVYDGVLHEDTYGALESENGEVIPMDAFEPAPVNP
ncbi:hypothetical protein GBA65_21565 (plasmid) [Rubrobacter marinus]|uniref:YoaR-like putative peptidoglycan binding domain-containing protein n=1 Tax=Rubrobacter marinus TaxID=2653852 RepID=A0A6G8Q3K2_9ACTN|nr:peptidoglycan binding domain-containing protein [Rubrobacter marinus]QIN81036.1 hypothetical protein GBA65_21565 [Rubrobacter marinus]